MNQVDPQSNESEVTLPDSQESLTVCNAPHPQSSPCGLYILAADLEEGEGSQE